MGKIYYVMGKSASGKDTIFNRLHDECPRTKKIITYTTRPKRSEDVEGVSYHFVDESVIEDYRRQGKLIEMRTYNTVQGRWTYATIDDGSVHLESKNYLIIGTLESYKKIREYFGAENVVPIYIDLSDGIRLQRAVNREMMEEKPNYAELCRRYLADSEDFSDARLEAAGITKRYLNEDLNKCILEIKKDMGII